MLREWRAPTPRGADPARYVDTLIGTGSSATGGQINNFPGAAVPFGMVQYSPDTTDAYTGYHHDNDHVRGFSLTHASVGCPAFGDIPMLPTTTPIGPEPWSAWEKIAHDNTEVGAPGSYTVRFPDTGVSAELTATTRTGVGRFRYPRNGKPALFHVRPGGSLAGNSAATIDIGGDNTTITASATTRGFCLKNTSYRVYFAMKFNRPFTSYGTWDGKTVFAGARRADTPSTGGYVEFPAGLGNRGTDRAVLHQCRCSASQPRRRGRQELRRRPRRRIGRMERRAVAHPGSRHQYQRVANLLHLPLPVFIAPQHV